MQLRSGTTVAVADQLKKQWVGIDQSVQAIKVSEMRLQRQQIIFSVNNYSEVINESVDPR